MVAGKDYGRCSCGCGRYISIGVEFEVIEGELLIKEHRVGVPAKKIHKRKRKHAS